MSYSVDETGLGPADPEGPVLAPTLACNLSVLESLSARGLKVWLDADQLRSRSYMTVTVSRRLYRQPNIEQIGRNCLVRRLFHLEGGVDIPESCENHQYQL